MKERKRCYIQRDTKPFLCLAVLLATLSDRSKDHHSHPENYLTAITSWLTDITDVLGKITLPTSPFYECHLEWVYTLSFLIPVVQKHILFMIHEIELVNLSSRFSTSLSDLLILQSSICFHRVVVHCSARPGGRNLFHLRYLCAKPDTRASAAHWAPTEGEGRFTHCGRGPGAFQWLAEGSEGHGYHPAGRTITHCDHTHTGLGMKKHAGSNPNKTMTICCSWHAKLQNKSTHNRAWRYKEGSISE